MIYFLENIKNNLLESDYIRKNYDIENKEINHNSYYEEINYNKEFNYLYIRLKEDRKKLNYKEFRIIFDEYNIMIYDLLENNQISDIERFSLNHIQFENDNRDIYISDLIDNFFISIYHYQ